eukprot:TRINITY_DN33348_c0_g1_i1.p1 TRINITY_DN33348_c0_g1~~TRINITY_DN33348_c0_g1_i1.p1  ORF type:complete len:138 (-),score=37.13 TRINITY_DN33348_c0_g1_i1:103-516(-)
MAWTPTPRELRRCWDSAEADQAPAHRRFRSEPSASKRFRRAAYENMDNEFRKLNGDLMTLDGTRDSFPLLLKAFFVPSKRRRTQNAAELDSDEEEDDALLFEDDDDDGLEDREDLVDYLENVKDTLLSFLPDERQIV